jgi:hypothetical protein
MKSIYSIPSEDIHHRPDVIRLKRRFGMAYGIIVGLSFAASSWGVDGYQLNSAQAILPWLKFLIGALICSAAGGVAGWLVARFEKGLLAVLLYLVVSLLYSWLVVSIPFQIFPRVVTWIDPETGNLLNYVFHENFNAHFTVAFVWVTIFVTLSGILQLPMVEPATFSTSLFGRIAPMIVCSVIMIINGSIVDTINNQALRSPVIEMNRTIQFSVDHRGEEVDRAVSRAMHLTSLRTVLDVVDQPRQLIVGSYDPWLGQVNVLVRFGDTWVDCAVVYNQPSFCKFVTPNEP